MPTPAAPSPEVRDAVREVLTRSAAFNALPPEKQRQVAQDTARVAQYLAAPEGIPGNTLASGMNIFDRAANSPQQASYKDARQAVDAIGEDFEASAAMAGARAAGAFMKEVNFVEFVSGLIDGVFNSIVSSNIRQMEAYSELVSSVSKSLNQFRDENTTPNQGRDHMADSFPDVFEIGSSEDSDAPGPRLKLRDGVDETRALAQINGSLGGFEGGALTSLDVSDPEAEAKLITAARSHIASARQQMLATMVMMGLSRIVVTDGKLSAKIVYDFKTTDSRKMTRSAAAYDHARDRYGNLEKNRAEEGSSETTKDLSGQRNTPEYSSQYFTKGDYKYQEKPVLTAMSTATESQDSSINVKAQLAGNVEVNFKTDYLALEKMATPEMMAELQMRSKPVDRNRPVYAAGSTPPPAAAPPATTPAPVAA